MMHPRHEKLIQLIELDEGFIAYPRKDGRDGLSVGYGHNLLGKPLSKKIAMHMMLCDLEEAWDECNAHFKFFTGLDDVRKAVLIDMCYNLGIRKLMRFVLMLEAIDRGNYDEAAEEMRESDWYKQVGVRAMRLVRMMKDGIWPQALEMEYGEHTRKSIGGK